jgi:hypothetical protein
MTRGINFREDFQSTGSWSLDSNGNLNLSLSGSPSVISSYPAFAVRAKNNGITPDVNFYSGSVVLSSVSPASNTFSTFTGSLSIYSGSFIDRIQISSTTGSFPTGITNDSSYTFQPGGVQPPSGGSVGIGVGITANVGSLIIAAIAYQNFLSLGTVVTNVTDGNYSFTRQSIVASFDETVKMELWTLFSPYNGSQSIDIDFNTNTNASISVYNYSNVAGVMPTPNITGLGSSIVINSTYTGNRLLFGVVAQSGSSALSPTNGQLVTNLSPAFYPSLMGVQLSGSGAITITGTTTNTTSDWIGLGLDLIPNVPITTYSTDGDILNVVFQNGGSGSVDFIQLYQENVPLLYVDDKASYALKKRVVPIDAPMREQQIIQTLGSESPTVDLGGVFITDTTYTAQNYRDKLLNIWQEGNYQWAQFDFIGAKFIIEDVSIDEVPGVINYYKWTTTLRQYTPTSATLQNYNLT